MSNLTFKISKSKRRPAVTLLIAVLILSTVLAVSFSLATILLAESRNSGDLIRTEPALYADNAISEEAIFNVSRSTGVTSYNTAVGSLAVTSTSTPLNNPVQQVKIPSGNTTYGCGSNCYVLYNPSNPYGPGGYGRIQVTFLNTSTNTAKLNVFLCQWDPANPPKNANGTYKNVCSDNTDLSYMTYSPPLIGTSLSAGQTWDTNTCGGCMDSSGNSQQELILTQTNGSPAANIYAQISTWDSGGNPLGIPYFGQTAVTISSTNAGVNRDVKVVVPLAPASSAGSGGGFAHSRALTINSGQVLGTQTNFPVLVCFNATLGNGAACPTATELKSAGSGGQVQSGSGTDIIFTSDSAGNNLLPYEQENYVASSGEMEYWVKLPSAAAGTVFYMFYDKAGAVDQSNANAVWNSNYAEVWHLPNGSTLSANDSTSNGNSGAVSGATAVSGQIDGAAHFNGSSNKITANDSATLDVGTSSFSVSAWVRPAVATGLRVANKWQSFPTTGWLFDVNEATGGGNASGNIRFRGADGTHNVDYAVAGGIAVNNWAFIAASADQIGHTLTLYVNGSPVGSTSIAALTASLTTPTQFGVGTIPSFTGNWFSGNIDEVRFLNSALSANWIAAEYNNQSSPLTFYTVGPEN